MNSPIFSFRFPPKIREVAEKSLKENESLAQWLLDAALQKLKRDSK